MDSLTPYSGLQDCVSDEQLDRNPEYGTEYTSKINRPWKLRVRVLFKSHADGRVETLCQRERNKLRYHVYSEQRRRKFGRNEFQN